MKVLPEAGIDPNDPKFYGLIIEESIQRSDVIDGQAQKIVCYAPLSRGMRLRSGRTQTKRR